MSVIGGYNAYSQPLIQQRATQTPASEDDSSTRKSSATSREELFRSILKANETDTDNNVSSGREAARSEASQGRGQFVDITV